MSTQSAYAQEVERAVVELLQQLMKVSHVSAREVESAGEGTEERVWPVATGGRSASSRL